MWVKIMIVGQKAQSRVQLYIYPMAVKAKNCARFDVAAIAEL